jgi:hypothetical protein
VDSVDSRNSAPAHTVHSPDDYGVVPFSIIKWSPFQLSRFKRGAQNGPLFDQQMVPFSIDKNNSEFSREQVF